MRIKKIAIFILLSILVFPAMALALNFQSGDQITNTENIDDDYYAAGRDIKFDANVNGDLFLAGSMITVNSNVSEDLNLAGGTIFVNGIVGDDMRVGGGNITVNSEVKDDFISGGGNITLGNSGSIGGNMIFGGGNVTINGPILGSVYGGGGNLYINNVINGDVKLYGIDNVKIGPNGKVMGNFSYQSNVVSDSVNSSTIAGSIDYRPFPVEVSEKNAKSVLGGLIAGFSIFRLLSILLTGLVLLWLFRKLMGNALSKPNVLTDFGIGLLFIIATPVVALILAVSGIGIGLTFLLMLLWILVMQFGKFLAIFWIGTLILPTDQKSGLGRSFGAFAIGAVIYVALIFIPVLGWLAKCVLVMFGTGALLIYAVEAFRKLTGGKKA